MARSWLWKFEGRLQVISTPFHHGVHYATRPEHFLPIVEHLQEIHKGGFVHGDIRAFNMVLNYETKYENESKPQGWLIDFDFGGKISSDVIDDGNLKHSFGYLNPKYPSGYEDRLEDGLRLGRHDGDIIMSHDWFALGYIIFDLHKLTHPNIDWSIRALRRQVPETQKLDEEEFSRLLCFRWYFEILPWDDPEKLYSEEKDLGAFLKEYLHLAQMNGFHLAPTKAYETCLQDCNML